MFLLLALTSASYSSSNGLLVKIENLKSEKGHILYIVFNQKEGFPDKADASVKQGKVPVSELKDNSFELKDLPPGKYALSVIHDENDNDKLDTNFLGIPKEGFGFSNNPKVYFGPPSFDKCVFDSSSTEVLEIQLKHF